MCDLFNGISGVMQRREGGALSIMDQIDFEVPDQYTTSGQWVTQWAW